jgi:hypothetical protein
MDDDIRLITRAGQRRLADEDFADIFDFGEGEFNVFLTKYFIMEKFCFPNFSRFCTCL